MSLTEEHKKLCTLIKSGVSETEYRRILLRLREIETQRSIQLYLWGNQGDNR